MKLSKQQVLKLIYEQQVWDSETPEEVEPVEDAWGTGEDLEQHLDYQEIMTGEPVKSEIEIEEIVERLKRRLRLKRIIREEVAAAPPEVVEELPAEEEVVVAPPPAEAEEEERAGASSSSLRGFFSEKAAEVADLGISDPQIPALIAAMNDLIGQAQTGTLGAREKRVRANIAKA